MSHPPLQARNRAGQYTLSILTINILFLIAECLIQFYRHREIFTLASDGRFMNVLFSTMPQWQPNLFVEAWSPLFLLGSNAVVNSLFVPASWPFLFGLTDLHTTIACYTILALQLFLGMYLLCRVATMTRGQSLFVGWVCVNMVLPLIERSPPLGEIYTWSPVVAHSASLILFCFAAFMRTGRAATVRTNLLWASFFIGTSILQVITAILTSPIAVPVTIIGCGCLFFMASTRKERAWKLGTGALLVGFMLTGPLFWTAGRVLYSARSVFNPEIVNAGPMTAMASCVFYGNLIRKFCFASTLAGGLLMLMSKQRVLRYTGYGFLSYAGLHVTISAIYLSGTIDFRPYPFPVYLEYEVTPLFSLFASYAALRAYEFLYNIASKHLGVTTDKLKTIPPVAWGMSRPGTVLVSLAVCYILGQGVSTIWFKKYKPALSLQPSPITDTLVKTIALKPGGTFQGRSASLFASGSFTDDEIAAGLAPLRPDGRYTHWQAGMNNSHAIDNLWIYDIPTLDGYEASLSAPYYVLYSRLASHTPWIINHTGISRFNLPLLAASGTRYVITSRPVRVEGMEPRALVTLRDGRLADQGLVANAEEFARRAQPEAKGFFLYELPRPNLGQYSPTVVRPAPSVSETLTILEDARFDYSREVVLHEPLPEGQALVPGTLDSLHVVRGGLKVRAHSTGRSLLLLPFEFSRAWTWVPDRPDGGAVILQRADLALTALVFTGRVAGTLRFEFGPWSHPKARLEDLDDIKRMGIKDIPLRPLTGKDRFF